MSREFGSQVSSGYAAFRLRFRALLLDAGICFDFFLIAGIGAGVVLEQYRLGRAVAFVLIAGAILCYEPVMVSFYGGTFGHRALNIRVVRAQTERLLPLPRAFIRSLIKQLLGVFSLAFMFVTRKAQGLHDLAAGSEVQIRNPQTAHAADYFVPEALPTGQLQPTALRRIVAIALYNALFFLIVSLVLASSLSSSCLNEDVCTNSERQGLSLLTFVWLAMSAVMIGLGWKGRLPGARKNLP